MGTDCILPAHREPLFGGKRCRHLQDITPEQAAEQQLVSKPGFSPLSESALLDACEIAALAAN